MPSKKNNKTIYVQYSKKLTTAIVAFWFLARAFVLVAAFINPDSGNNMSLLIKGIDDIAAVCVIAYTTNSVGEKGLTTYFDYKKADVNKQKNEEEVG